MFLSIATIRFPSNQKNIYDEKKQNKVTLQSEIVKIKDSFVAPFYSFNLLYISKV